MHQALSRSVPTQTDNEPRIGHQVRLVMAVGLYACSGLFVLLTLWGESSPTGISIPGMLLSLVLAGVGILLVAVLIAACLVTKRFSFALPAAAFVAVLVAVMTSFNLPLQGRFALAQPAFEQIVAERAADGATSPCPSKAGSFQIQACASYGNSTYFTVPGAFMGDVGFAYLPDGVPTGRDQIAESYEPLSGRWYTFSND